MQGRKLLAMVLGGAALAVAAAQAAENATAPPRGKAVYSEFCVQCHGVYGRGDGPALEYFAARPPDMTFADVLASRSDAEVVKELRERSRDPQAAHSPMVIAGALNEDALRDAIAYMRTMSVPGKHVSVAAGKDIYTTVCWVCHGLEGNGKGPAAKNLVDAKPRDFTRPDFVIEGREERIYRNIALGAAKAYHGPSYMPEWQTSLSPQQIRDVMEYSKTFQAAKPKP